MNSAPITLESLAVRVTSLEHTAHENSENHGKIYARIEAVEKGQAVINTSLVNIEKVCDEISADVKALKERPMKRYDAIANAVLQWLVLAILAAVVVFK